MKMKNLMLNWTFPTASTCFKTLKLPAHFQMYKDFEEAIISLSLHIYKQQIHIFIQNVSFV